MLSALPTNSTPVLPSKFSSIRVKNGEKFVPIFPKNFSSKMRFSSFLKVMIGRGYPLDASKHNLWGRS